MEDGKTPQTSWSGRPVGARPSMRIYLLVSVCALAMVALPFWFWYSTWFGRALSDSSIEEFLHQDDKPRREQQALVQIGEMMAKGDSDARKWYPRVIELSNSSNDELRQTTAWIMGQDKSHEPFRAALMHLLNDRSLLVRRNAALGLAAFRDRAGIKEIKGMLHGATIPAPVDGRIEYRLHSGEYVNAGTLIARVNKEEVRSPLPGEVRSLTKDDDVMVKAGETIAELAPDDQHVWEALRALFVIGTKEDEDDVRPFLRSPVQKLKDQAEQTIQHIEGR